MALTSYDTECLCTLSAQVQCDLGTIGHNIADRLVYEDICLQDKLDFILAHAYKIMICDTAIGCSDLTNDQMQDIVNYLSKYRKKRSFHNSNCGCK